jgi:hypothetical protein
MQNRKETMSETNPEIEQQLNDLAELCCEALAAEQTTLEERSKPLLKSLLMSGYVRKGGRNLQADVESRVKKQCAEPAMHRGGALSGLTKRLQDQLDELARWESKKPSESSPAKPANISSATDA